MIHLLAFNVSVPSQLNLLLPLLVPFLELITTVCLAVTFQILLSLLLLVKLFLALFCFLLHTLHSFTLFIVKVVLTLAHNPWAS
jgi:hypothetical protein